MEWLIGLVLLVVIAIIGIKGGNKKGRKKISSRRPSAKPTKPLNETQLDVLSSLNSKGRKNSKSNVADVEISYELKDTLLTPTEQQFLKVLEDVIGKQLRVFSMVRVADVLTANSSFDWSDRKLLFRRISQKHFDFVICNPKTLEIVCVIELNDKSHNQKNRKKRDEFLTSACDSAGLPLLFVSVASSYDHSELKEFVFGSYADAGRKAA